jgi:hypothetical protein
MLNPGGPTHWSYFNLADQVIVSERSHKEFISPPTEIDSYDFLNYVPGSYGMKLQLPKTTRTATASKMGVMVHGFAAGKTRKERVIAMGRIVGDLIEVKKLGGIFITDLEIEKGDVYAGWSGIWEEFVGMVVACNNGALMN